MFIKCYLTNTNEILGGYIESLLSFECYEEHKFENQGPQTNLNWLSFWNTLSLQFDFFCR